jgi:hypothetical protein
MFNTMQQKIQLLHSFFLCFQLVDYAPNNHGILYLLNTATTKFIYSPGPELTQCGNTSSFIPTILLINLSQERIMNIGLSLRLLVPIIEKLYIQLLRSKLFIFQKYLCKTNQKKNSTGFVMSPNAALSQRIHHF